VVKSADLGQRGDAALVGQLDRARLGRILVEREVGARAVVVAEVAVQTTTKMSLVQDDHVVEKLAADGADQSLGEGVLLRGAWCREDLGDAHALHPSSKLAAVDAVAIAKERARRRVIGERLGELLSGPDSDSTVLLTGETGTGKELVARAIHKRSRRASRAFVAVNCAAIPQELIPSELFGHEKGAFTGAIQRRLGRFELADGGTIFLDELGELSPDTQVALLRVLQEQEFERVGGTQPIKVNVRVIAATNRDLKSAAEEGTFRQDLFYRLNVFPLEIPPLRERREDIPLLLEYFIDRFARRAGKTIRRVNKRTLKLLQSYPWPGNVRELQNVIERSIIVSEGEEFTVDESWLSTGPAVNAEATLSGALSAREKAMIEDALRASGGRVFGSSGAAARLGIPRSTLESRIRALKINKNRFRV
jgi:transcriptional regulator with PAS, ATPase and Fis domain